ncbi:hypothetical protein ACQKII_02300 [Lysinibacillus sp. NPDC048646]|uniref:hypothetical protein n=1 Tax=Lysinibacillus sp. NPDC048646 TaxID=3390574 RepID=UPI003D00759E
MAGFTSYFLSSYMIGLEIFAVKYYVYQLKAVFGLGIVIMALFDGLSVAEMVEGKEISIKLNDDLMLNI